MSFRNAEFFVKEAFLGLSRNRLMSFITFGTIVVSLIVYGFFTLSLYNVYSVTRSFQSKLEIMAFIKDDVDDTGINQIKAQIVANIGVKKLDYISKEQAWDKFRERFGDTLNLLEDNNNPLPNSFKVEAVGLDQVKNVAEFIKGLEGIEDVRYGFAMIEKISKLVKAVELGGTILVSLLVLAAFLIIVNTIRLTVIARQNEIVIMQLVGATDGFIKWPFILEGIFLGLSGALVAAAILMYVYSMVALPIAENFSFLVIVTGGRVLTYIYLSVIVMGTFLGMLGGYLSVTRSLRMVQR